MAGQQLRSEVTTPGCLLLFVPHRLVGPSGAPDVARQLMRLRLSAVWVLMVAFEGPVAVPGDMEGEPGLGAAAAPQRQLRWAWA